MNLWIIALFSTLLIAAQMSAQTLDAKITAPAKSSASFNLDLAIGFASFQDLQIPYAESQTSPEATPTETLSNHRGPLISANLGITSAHGLGRHYLEFGGIRATTLGSANPSRPATYERLAGSLGEIWQLHRDWSYITGLELRRSSYRTTDTGHYIDGALIRAGLERYFSDFNLSGTFAYAPKAQLGYTQNNQTGESGTLAETTVSVFEGTLAALWKADEGTDFFFQTTQERSQIEIKNSDGYRMLGLVDQRTELRTGPYELTTTLITIGAVRHF